jgi:hypothetical protein
MSSLLRARIKLTQFNKFTARYQPYTVDHSSWPKPFNVLDNADPSRFDREIKDEYDLFRKY